MMLGQRPSQHIFSLCFFQMRGGFPLAYLEMFGATRKLNRQSDLNAWDIDVGVDGRTKVSSDMVNRLTNQGWVWFQLS